MTILAGHGEKAMATSPENGFLEETNYGNVKKTLSTYPLARELLLTKGINNREYNRYQVPDA